MICMRELRRGCKSESTTASVAAFELMKATECLDEGFQCKTCRVLIDPFAEGIPWL